jgi:hypothetical protein
MLAISSVIVLYILRRRRSIFHVAAILIVISYISVILAAVVIDNNMFTCFAVERYAKKVISSFPLPSFTLPPVSLLLLANSCAYGLLQQLFSLSLSSEPFPPDIVTATASASPFLDASSAHTPSPASFIAIEVYFIYNRSYHTSD